MTKDGLNIEAIESSFESKAKMWQDLYKNPQRANDVVLINRMEIAVDLLKEQLSAGARVLDAGCGPGVVAKRLAESGFIVHGVDIASKMIDFCKETFADVLNGESPHRFSVGDIFKMNLDPQSFDGVVALGFLEYQADEVAVLKRLHELTRPGGALVVSGPLNLSASNLFGLRDPINRLRFGKTLLASRNRYSVSRMTELLDAAGFRLIKHKRHGFAGFPYAVESLIGLKGGLFINDSLTALSNVLPISQFSSDIVVLATRT